MARSSWIGDDSTPDLDAHVEQLEHFTQSIADGVIDASELATQEAHLVAAMKAVESTLKDEQHAGVTKLPAELTAYSVEDTRHGPTPAQVERAVAPKA